jgi:O-antigen/teichoic acid export membrane protein
MIDIAASRGPTFVRDVLRAVARVILPAAANTHGLLTRRIALSSVAALAVYVTGAGVTYCTQMLIARIIGANGYGIYAYAVTWMTVLANFSALGFDVSLLRFVPAYRAQQASRLMKGVILYAKRTVAAVGIGTGLLGAAAIALDGDHLSRELVDTFLIGFTVVPIWALLWISCSTVRAFGGVASALLPDRVLRDGLLLCLLLITARGSGWRFGASTIMGGTVICSAVALYVVSWARVTLQSKELAGVQPTYSGGLWLRCAAPLVVIVTVEAFMNRTGVVLLGWAGEVRDAGIYAVAFNVALLVKLPCTAVNILFAPTAAELFARGDRAGLQSVLVRIGIWTLLSAVFIAVPLWLVAHMVMALFGHDFADGVTVLRILLVAQVIAAAVGSLPRLMLMTGHERGAMVLLVLSATAGGLLGAVLIGRSGLTGAAVGTMLTLLVWSAAMTLFVWWRLRLLPGVLGICLLPLDRFIRNHRPASIAEVTATEHKLAGTQH